MHYRIQLEGSVIVLLASMFINKIQLKFGFMISAFINIFYNSAYNWKILVKLRNFLLLLYR
jgi:hypothetical protein